MSAHAVREREETLNVGSDFAMPEVLGVSSEVRQVVDQDRLVLTSAYYDTADLDLLRNGVTLRHREGPIDAGWLLKVPDSETCREIDLSRGNGAVPRELSALVVGLRHGRPLKQVVTLHIERGVTHLLGKDGQLLATLSDDSVQATSMLGRTASKTWREVDVELGEAGSAELLAALDARLIRAGAKRSQIHTKLMRALGQSPAQKPPLPARPTAGIAVVGYLTRQVSEILVGDVEIRADHAAVERARLGVRRIRSVLQVYAELFDGDRRDSLDGELAWYDALLTVVREIQVARARLAQASDGVGDVVSEDAMSRIDELLLDELEVRSAALMRAVRGRRYQRLVDELREWSTTPPTTDVAGAPVHALERQLRPAQRRAAKIVGQLSEDDADLGEALTALANVADAGELVRPRAARPRRGKLRRRLTEYDDAQRTAELLHSLGGPAAPDGFALGVLYTLEKTRAAQARAAL